MNNTILNSFLLSLYGKVSEEDLNVIKSTIFIFFDDYNIVPKETLPMNLDNDITLELRHFLLSSKLEGKSEKTLKQYDRTNTKFLYWVNKPVNKITSNDIRCYLLTYQQTNNVSDVTLDNQRMYISSFFRWLCDNDYLDKNPCRTIKVIKKEVKEREPLTEVELEQLRNVITLPRDKAVLETLYSTGCRVSELVNMKVTDIDFFNGEVEVVGKGKKHRTVYLNTKSILALKEWLQVRPGESEYVFTNTKRPFNPVSSVIIERTLRRLGREAHLSTKVFPHRVRHTTATDALRRGMKIEEVRDMLGHNSISTTLIYAKVDKSNIKTNHAKYIV